MFYELLVPVHLTFSLLMRLFNFLPGGFIGMKSDVFLFVKSFHHTQLHQILASRIDVYLMIMHKQIELPSCLCHYSINIDSTFIFEYFVGKCGNKVIAS